MAQHAAEHELARARARDERMDRAGRDERRTRNRTSSRVAGVGSISLTDRHAAETSASAATRSRWCSAVSAAIKPPIELPTRATTSSSKTVADAGDRARVAGDRDRRRRRLRVPKAGQVERDDAPLGRDARDVLKPVLQRPPSPCTNRTGAAAPEPMSITCTRRPSSVIARMCRRQSTLRQSGASLTPSSTLTPPRERGLAARITDSASRLCIRASVIPP